MASTKTVTVTIRPEFDELIQAMCQVAEMFNDVADQMAALNNHTEAEETSPTWTPAPSPAAASAHRWARGGYDCTCEGNPRCESSNESHGVQCEADAGGLLPCPCVLPSGHGGLHACKCSILDPDEYPEPESVTVTLPERILGRPWTVVELRMLAEWADNAGSGEAGAVLGHVADALDAANGSQS